MTKLDVQQQVDLASQLVEPLRKISATLRENNIDNASVCFRITAGESQPARIVIVDANADTIRVDVATA